MSFSCYIQQDTRRPKKDGLYPIIIRLTVNRKTTGFQTNIAVKENEWDAKHLRIKGSAKSVSNTGRLNYYLGHCKAVCEEVLFELSQEQKLHELSLSEIKKCISKRIDGYNVGITIGQLVDIHIEKLNKEKRFGTARAYFEFKQFLIKYRGTVDIAVTAINYDWLSKLETDYKAQGHGLNGLGVRLRALRALINHNRKSGVIDAEFNPFLNYTIKSEKTRKRALTKEDFDKIVQADETGLTAPMIRARKFFLISYYMLGVSYHDMAQLKVGSIQDGKIFYRRAKTKRLYSVKISNRLAELLEEFTASKGEDDYILPIAQNGLSEYQQSGRIKNSIGRYNKCLKKLANQLGIQSQNMSSYVARHSLATHARDVSGIEIPVISQMLGHNDTATTAVYLASINDDVIDDAVDRMFG